MLVAASRMLVPSRVSIAKRNFPGLAELDDKEDDENDDVELDEEPPADLGLALVNRRIYNSWGSIGMSVRIVLKSTHPALPCTGWSSV